MHKKKYESISIQQRAIKSIQILRHATKGMALPASNSLIKEFGKNPYLILIHCLLSLRTRDTVSLPAARRLFEHANTPDQMLALPEEKIEKLIYPTGFYKRKAHLLKQVSQDLIIRFSGKVPDNMNDLLSIKGVGSKTANLVLGLGFDIPSICVDTHVHRISNRLGLVKTKTPSETEIALKKILPKKYWIEFNQLLVMWGQNICVPISPLCSKCAIFDYCKRIGVKNSR